MEAGGLIRWQSLEGDVPFRYVDPAHWGIEEPCGLWKEAGLIGLYVSMQGFMKYGCGGKRT